MHGIPVELVLDVPIKTHGGSVLITRSEEDQHNGIWVGGTILTNMLAMKVKKKSGIFSCLKFCLLIIHSSGFYGRNPVLPIVDVLLLNYPDERTEVYLDSYKVEITALMVTAWKAARNHICIAQSK